MNVLKFGAEWCSQCRAMDKELKEHPLIIEPKIIDVDDDDSEEFVEKYSVRNIPTIIILEGDTEIKRWIGRTSSEEINNYLKNNERKES
jgi:thioredoxin-like negative regulator of GroEL